MVLHILFMFIAIGNLVTEDLYSIYSNKSISNIMMGVSRVINTILLIQLFCILYRLPNETNLA